MAEKIADIKDLFNELQRCGDHYVGQMITPDSLHSLYTKLLDIGNRWKAENLGSRIQCNGKDIYLETLIIRMPTYGLDGVIHVHVDVNNEEYIPDEKDDTEKDYIYEPIDLKKLWGEVSHGDDIDAALDAYRETVTDYFKKRYVGKAINNEEVQDDARMLMYIARYVNESTRILNKNIEDLGSQLEDEIRELKRIIMDKGDN